MRIYKKVLSHDSGLWILCAWDDCERQGYDLYKVRVGDGINEYTGEPKHIQYVFCSERHKMYWVNSHVRYGAVAPGYGSVT